MEQMAITRLIVRNEFGLGHAELYRNVDREDPKAVLDGVAVSGLVGILRQLGDLAEFAAEIFHGIQEEVMTAASKNNKLMIRLKHIEAIVPSLEKTMLAQTNRIHFAYTSGQEWHPRIQNDRNHFICYDLPQSIMNSYEECRDPPRLHFLDKFDIDGPGSCLKRYSDPTYFRRASDRSIEPNYDFKKNDKNRKIKKKISLQRNQDTSHLVAMNNHNGRRLLISSIFNDNEQMMSTATSSAKTEEKLNDFTVASVFSKCRSEDENHNISYSPSREQAIETGFVMDERETESEGDTFVDALNTVESESESITYEHEREQDFDNDLQESTRLCSGHETLSSENIHDEHVCEDSGMDLEIQSPNDDLSACNDVLDNSKQGFITSASESVRGYSKAMQENNEARNDIQPVTLWTNGSLLGLQPSKPLVFEAINGFCERETEKEETFEEFIPFDLLASSPPLEHMKISFKPAENPQISKLKLKFPDKHTFLLFQLVSESATAVPVFDSDDDTFCESSPYMSDNDSVSSFRQWEESSDSHDREDHECLDKRTRVETSSISSPRNHSYLQSPAEPSPPPLPPIHWRVSKTLSERFEDRQQSPVSRRSCIAAPHDIFTLPIPENKVHKKNNDREDKQNVNGKEIDTDDFLQQIRTKQSNLRPTPTTRSSITRITRPLPNANINAILEKANSIRQAVASDDGDESDTWSET